MSSRPAAMDQFAPIVGRWRVQADLPLDPPVRMAGEQVHEWLGELLVIRSVMDGPVPSSISVVGGRQAERRADQPVAYFDDRGVRRRMTTRVQDGVWHQRRDPGDDWKHGPDGPGFDQRLIGVISADGDRIDARWERSEDGTTWELDFEVTYTRLSPGS